MEQRPLGIRKRIMAALASFSIFYLMPLVSATTTTCAGSSATLAGSLGLLVSLGIENIPGVSAQQARVYYRWICFSLIMWIALTADKKSSTIFGILAVSICATTAWFGWFTVQFPDGTLNPAGPWGLIILCTLLTVASYMTETKRINWGIYGAGDPLINIFTFFILLNGTIGLINGAAIFPTGIGVATPAYCSGTDYSHCQINGATQLQNLQTNTNTGSILNIISDWATAITAAAWNVVLLVVQIAVSIAAVGLVILITYPWISQSPSALALLAIFQVAIWLIYALTLARWYGKTSYGEMRL